MPDGSSLVPSGMPAFFAEQTVRGLFAARNGLFLIDPARLAHHVGGNIADSRLLESFTAHGRGVAVCSEGVMVPAFGVEAGYYTVLLRSTETEDALTPLTHIVYSTGFVLGTATGDLVVCNTDHLSRSPSPSEHANAERPVHISPGWYSATVVAGIREAEQNEEEGWVCAFLLDPQEAQPDFTADLAKTLSFFAG